MNYLAHALLSGNSDAAITGGLLGDFVKGRLDGRFDTEVTEAIVLHRAVDRFTDAHAIPHASRALISPARRRFAGVLVDVFYDHFLARHWSRYCDIALEDFTAHVYAILLPQRDGFPERLRHVLPHMAANDWLASYAELWAVNAALNGIARRFQRFPRAIVLVDAVIELETNYREFEEHFLAFFPELMRYAHEYRVARPARDPTRVPARTKGVTS
jgi:acyl carrier protein phosphodiesterase